VLGLYRPTSGEIGSVAAEFGLHHLVVDDAIAAHQRPKLERYGASNLGVSGLLKQRVMAEAEEGAGGIAWRLTGDRFVSSLSLRAAVGSTFTR
jgi:hypothetical protein